MSKQWPSPETKFLKQSMARKNNKETPGTVYMFRCETSNFKYIGETGMTIKQRTSGHRSAVNRGDVRASVLAEHHLTCKDAKINLYDPEILVQEPTKYIRKFKEAIAIRTNPHTM